MSSGKVSKQKKDKDLIFTDPDAFEQKYTFYAKHCKEEQEVPDWEGLANYIGISVRELDEIGRDPDMMRYVDRARTSIIHIQKQMAYKGKINLQAFKMNATKNHQYTDKVEQKVNQTVVQKEASALTDAELKKELDRLRSISKTDTKVKPKKKKRKRLKK